MTRAADSALSALSDATLADLTRPLATVGAAVRVRPAHPDGLPSDVLRGVVGAVAWRAFRAAGDRSIRLRLGPVPVSVRVGRLRPVVEALFGPEPGPSESPNAAGAA